MRSLKRGLAAVAVVALLAGSGQAAAKRSKSKSQPAPISAATYKVVKGDTLGRIAARAGTTSKALAELNGVKNARRLRIGTVLKLPTAPAPQGDPRLPERLRQDPARLALLPAFDKAAAKHKVPADLLKAMTWMESGWQNDKVSHTNAVGIGQLMPATIEFVNGPLLKGPDLDPKKPIDNINMSARYLAWLLKSTNGDTAMALAGYYQGLASVRRQGPLAETKVYVENVLALRDRF